MPRVVMFVAWEKVSVPRRVPDPAAPPREILPEPALKTMLPGPSNVLLKVMGLEALVRVAVPVALRAPAKLIELALLIELLRIDGPEPV